MPMLKFTYSFKKNIQEAPLLLLAIMLGNLDAAVKKSHILASQPLGVFSLFSVLSHDFSKLQSLTQAIDTEHHL